MALDVIDELIGAPEFTETADFSGSLDYIDSLGYARPYVKLKTSDVIAARNASDISNAYFSGFDVDRAYSALPRDNRRFNPSKSL